MTHVIEASGETFFSMKTKGKKSEGRKWKRMEKEIRSRHVKLLSFNTIWTFTEEHLSRSISDIEENLKFMHRERMSVNYDP